MKNFIKFIFWVVVISYGLTFAQETYLHGVATGYNVVMDFDKGGKVGVVIDSFKDNVCNSGKKGFLLTGKVNREGNGYVYFSEPDGDNTVNSCVAIVLSGKDFILTGVGHTASGRGYKMSFNNIKLIYNSTKKAYYFSGEAIDDALGVVNSWSNVYVTGLNLIDWSKTVIDYSDLTDGNLVANGNEGYVNIYLKDIGGNKVYILDKITVKIVGVSSNLQGYVFLDTAKNLQKTYTLNTSTSTPLSLQLPIYILKAVSNGYIKLQFSYDIPDINGNYSYVVTLNNIKLKQPVSDIGLSLLSTPIVGELFTGNLNVAYTAKGNISNTLVTGYLNVVDSDYNISLISFVNNKFTGKIYPKDPNKTKSKVSGKFVVTSYKVEYNNFPGIKVSYPFSKGLNIVSYADKRVDYDKSFRGMISNQVYSGGDFTNTLSFKPVLRDRHGYVIPDVKFKIKIKDIGNPNSYNSWDCNEIAAGYQTNCRALKFELGGNIYGGSVDGVLGSIFSYVTQGGYNYPEIKVASYKPVTGAQLKFVITDLENTSSDWNFVNSGNYISLPSNYEGYIKNIEFEPLLNLRLKGLDDDLNYVDINDNIYLEFRNNSSLNLDNVSYYLSGKITYPTFGVVFTTGGVLKGDSINISSYSNKLLEQTILFALSYSFNDDIKFNYNHGKYHYYIAGVGDLVLKPWNYFFNLSATYKLGGAYVDGLVNKAQKYVAGVKNILGRYQKSLVISFSKIYNKLKRRVKILLRGKQPIILSNTIVLNPSSFNGGVKYYQCNGWTIYLTGGIYKGSNTLVLKNCRLVIKGNIFKRNNNDNLVIFMYDDNNRFNLYNLNYIEDLSNVYITENVSDIQAAILTKGSVFTIDGDNVNWAGLKNQMILANRIHKIDDKQLYIKGALMAQNNVGGSLLVLGENKFTIGGSTKIDVNKTLWGVSGMDKLRDIAQIFDINFWRGFKYSGPNSIDPNWYSKMCDTEEERDKNEGCKYPVYIEYDPNIRNNILFKF